MLYQIEIGMKPHLVDPVGRQVLTDILDLGIKKVSDVRYIQIYVLEGKLTEKELDLVARYLLADPVVHYYKWRLVSSVNSSSSKMNKPQQRASHIITIFYKPGVMDPVEASTIKAIKDLGIPVEAVRTGRKYLIYGKLTPKECQLIARKVLANEVIEDVFYEAKLYDKIITGNPYQFKLIHIPLLEMDDESMLKLNEDYHLSLNLIELQTIQKYFKSLGRNPTDVELETIAQTWSEHCKHKTLTGLIEYKEMDESGKVICERRIDNLLKETVMKVTNELAYSWCISVFKDNAGIIEFDKDYAVCFKVETHNHPSAIEPYGGAGTGIGGVIRDTLGCGLGAKPLINTDVFCFGPLEIAHRKLPPGVLHPKRIMKGVVAGVRDYGNRMGIPTACGAVYFDRRYLGNPVVYCGNIGLIPRDKCFKNLQPGDLIVLVGGRTGRDGIHGVTFASSSLTEKSEQISASAVQIGNPIMEKKLVDAILQARDENLYSAITDCGGGGLSSAVGELGSSIGATVDLEKVPLKYEGLSYTEIWISEAQERMILAVPPNRLNRLMEIFNQENVEATVIGQFTDTKRLILKYQGNVVADLEMKFLHEGMPKPIRQAEWIPSRFLEPKLPRNLNYGKLIRKLLGMYNIASKEWIIRQYDHEVQGGSVLKPLTGHANDGPSDACVFRPRLESYRGIVVAVGMNPKYGDIDSYHMASSAIDEALRNIVAVGGNPHRTALLDNFSWGSPERARQLGALVRAAQACYDIAKVYETPFISGKDSLYNEFTTRRSTIAIPYTLLISAISVIDDVRKIVSMDFKKPDNLVYLIGLTHPELGGSHYYELLGYVGNNVPKVDPFLGKKILATIFEAIQQGMVCSCHDLSEGGLAVALAEMAFAGDIGVNVDLAKVPVSNGVNRDDIILFSESNSRFLVEVEASQQQKFEELLKGLPFGLIGQTSSIKRLKIRSLAGKLIVNEPLSALKDAWQKTLKF